MKKFILTALLLFSTQAHGFDIFFEYLPKNQQFLMQAPRSWKIEHHQNESSFIGYGPVSGSPIVWKVQSMQIPAKLLETKSQTQMLIEVLDLANLTLDSTFARMNVDYQVKEQELIKIQESSAIWQLARVISDKDSSSEIHSTVLIKEGTAFILSGKIDLRDVNSIAPLFYHMRDSFTAYPQIDYIEPSNAKAELLFAHKAKLSLKLPKEWFIEKQSEYELTLSNSTPEYYAGTRITILLFPSKLSTSNISKVEELFALTKEQRQEYKSISINEKKFIHIDGKLAVKESIAFTDNFEDNYLGKQYAFYAGDIIIYVMAVSKEEDFSLFAHSFDMMAQSLKKE